MTWNFNLSEAPRGHIETRTRVVKDEPKPFDFFVEDPIWAATKCGKVIKTHWMPQNGRDGGRWIGLGTSEEPVAWQPYITPEHPFAGRVVPGVSQVIDRDQIAALLPVIEDVGGGV